MENLSSTEIKEIFQYRNLVVYQHTCAYVKTIFSLLEKFPEDDEKALCASLRKATYSIPTNIAEGWSRVSGKQKLKYIENAFSALMSTVCQMEIAQELDYIDENDMEEIEEKANEIAKMLLGWIKKLTTQVHSPYNI